jgi:hypothetical protein
MKINLKKLQEVELEYKNSTIAYNTLNNMVNSVLSQTNPDTLNIGLAHATLTELGIIEWEGCKKPEKSE